MRQNNRLFPLVTEANLTHPVSRCPRWSNLSDSVVEWKCQWQAVHWKFYYSCTLYTMWKVAEKKEYKELVNNSPTN